jgi:ribosomal protein S14
MTELYKKGPKVFQDKNLRVLYKVSEGRFLALRCLGDSYFSYNSKNETSGLFMVSLPKIRNKCVISRKASSVFADFKISRTKLRSFVLFGFVPGIAKAAF